MKVTKKYLQASLTHAQEQLGVLERANFKQAQTNMALSGENTRVTNELIQTKQHLQQASELIHQSNAALFTLIAKLPGAQQG